MPERSFSNCYIFQRKSIIVKKFCNVSAKCCISLTASMDRLCCSLFYILEYRGVKNLLDWCMSMGLIASHRKCRICDENMKLVIKRNGSDGHTWLCRKKREGVHSVCVSVRKDSFFEESRLTICTILVMTYYWFHKLPNKFIMKELKLSCTTVVEWKGFCRELCLDILEIESGMIGGENVVVEIEVTKLGEPKLNRQGRLKGRWVFGGIELETNRIFLQVVEDKDKDTFLNILKSFILPGTTIISDCWQSYNCGEDEQFKQFAIENSLKFGHLDIGERINDNESVWYAIKRQVKGGICNGQFNLQLAEFLWRRSQPDVDFAVFLEGVKKVYPLQDAVCEWSSSDLSEIVLQES